MAKKKNTDQLGETDSVNSVDDAAKALEQSQSSDDNNTEAESDGNNDSEDNAGKSGGPDEPDISIEDGSKQMEQPNDDEIPLDKLPTAEEIEVKAQQFAKNPAFLEALRATVDRADAIVKAANQPAKKTVEEMGSEAFNKLVKIYGKDFVTAKKGNQSTYFSRKAWNAMSKSKNGWSEATAVMPEVAAVKSKK